MEQSRTPNVIRGGFLGLGLRMQGPKGETTRLQWRGGVFSLCISVSYLHYDIIDRRLTAVCSWSATRFCSLTRWVSGERDSLVV